MSITSATGADLPDVAHSNHGRTGAAWATNTGIVIGALVGGLGFIGPRYAVVWSGIGIMVVALIVGGILKAIGRGQRG